jgi:hypothetical protein
VCAAAWYSATVWVLVKGLLPASMSSPLELAMIGTSLAVPDAKASVLLPVQK